MMAVTLIPFFKIAIQEFVMMPLNKSKLAKTIRKVLDNKEA